MSLIAVMEALSHEGHRAREMAEVGKPSEPAVTVTLRADGMWYLDFYSYCLDLGDSSRHHEAYAEDLDTFIDHLWVMVEKAQRENDETS